MWYLFAPMLAPFMVLMLGIAIGMAIKQFGLRVKVFRDPPKQDTQD